MAGTIPSTFGPLVAGNIAKAGSGALQKSALQRALDMVGSPGGQTVIGAVGSGLSAYGQSKTAEANRAQGAAENKASLLQRERENAMQDERLRQMGALDAMPMGSEQTFAQKQALAKALLGSARNLSITPGDPAVAAAMGSRSGGMQLPAGGFDPAMLERLFGDEATSASIAARQKNVGQLSPGASFTSLGTLFGQGEGGSENPFDTDVRVSNQAAADADFDKSTMERQAIMQALEEGNKQPEQKKGSSIWKKIAKVGLAAAPFVAAPFTGGASLALIGAGAGAAAGAMDGGGVKGALMGGALGAIPGVGTSGSGVAKGAAGLVKNTVKNPSFLMNTGARALGR